MDRQSFFILTMDFEIRPFPKKTTARVAPPRVARDLTRNTTTTNAVVKKAPPLHCSHVCHDCLPPKPVLKNESGTQTLVHVVDTNVDKTYEWNEWELRRKALQLANIRSRATHSTQTHHSHMRRDNATQTWLRRDAVSQSRRHGHSNVPKPHVFLDGLRGQTRSHVVKVDLTRPVDE
ncbi:hypothetical protein JOB18_032117 [Solea senegalensis]|uniref:Cilia- and flagella-associated protein 206 n=1 Tax=Solea senegalensis TaxID=28829 RepID=A0AAV6PL92_SOLSE|nr:cilia- and flagella-associated protein 206-like isoform X1 [Solea senegalensis]KAG7467816.1 hypothetical protein JOB18_032117 [Solea senegalensis]